MESIYVFLVHHKKGKYQVKEFDGEDELETYLIKYLKKYKKYRIPPPSVSLFDLIKESIKVGLIVLDEKQGYGIVKVISGNEFEDSYSSSSEEYLESNDSESEEEEENEGEGEENEGEGEENGEEDEGEEEGEEEDEEEDEENEGENEENEDEENEDEENEDEENEDEESEDEENEDEEN
jgi:hypothetical protein